MPTKRNLKNKNDIVIMALKLSDNNYIFTHYKEVDQMNMNSLSHTKWECKYHILEYDQITLKEYIDLFTGEPVKQSR